LFVPAPFVFGSGAAMPSRKRRHQEEDAAPEDPSGAEVPSSAPQSPVRMTEASIRSPVPTR